MIATARTGRCPVRRRQTGPRPAIQQAFHAACVQAGFGTTNDKNGLHPAGLGVSPSNNIDGVRMSTAMTHLNPVRHHLNLTVRGGVFVRKILIKDGKAVGVEAESGGKVFQIEAGRVVLSAGAIRSPHLLMLSGIGPEDHLRQFGIPTVRHLPGVGQNLMNHLSAQMTFKVKDGISLAGHHRDAVHFRLALHRRRVERRQRHGAADQPGRRRTRGARPRRTDQIPGRRRSPRAGGADLTARSGCPTARDTSGWPRPTPAVQPSFNYCYLQHPNDIRRVREGLRMAAELLESDAYKDVVDYRIQPTDEVLADDDALDLWIRQTVGTARHVSGTCKMGPDTDPMAVVDQYCRVKGIQGLWVADASVMPRIPRSGGAHATVIMIGERVVDWIAAN